MLCDLRTRAVKSTAALLEHDEASTGLASLMPALTKVALGVTRQVGTVITICIEADSFTLRIVRALRGCDACVSFVHSRTFSRHQTGGYFSRHMKRTGSSESRKCCFVQAVCCHIVYTLRQTYVLFRCMFILPHL